MKIYVASHKKFDNIMSDELYTPLFVGAYKTDNHYGYLRDNVGDNISHKNNQYSEITGLYWIWKHATEDIVGLCHYRRYFSKSLLKSKEIIDRADVLSSLENHDIILHERRQYISNQDSFEKLVGVDFFEKSRNIFMQIHPKYLETFDKVFDSKIAYGCSCFVTSKEILDDYCEWLFAYLTALEDELEGDKERIIGYYAEVLLSVYVLHNNLKVNEHPFYYMAARNNFVANCIDYSYIISKIYYNTVENFIPKLKTC